MNKGFENTLQRNISTELKNSTLKVKQTLYEGEILGKKPSFLILVTLHGIIFVQLNVICFFYFGT